MITGGAASATAGIPRRQSRSSGSPVLPVFPWSQQHQPSITRIPLDRRFEEIIRLQLAFKADRVQVHVLAQASTRRRRRCHPAQEHVLRPACAANQDRLAVDAEQPKPFPVNSERDLPNPELTGSSSQTSAALNKAQCHVLQMRLTHQIRPPHIGFCTFNCGNFSGANSTVISCCGASVTSCSNGIFATVPVTFPETL